MFADFSLYSLSLWVHISAAVVGLGATFALAVGFPLALKLDPRHLPFVHHLSRTVNQRLASPALLVLIGLGAFLREAKRDAALGVAKELSAANPTSVYEIRPIALYVPEARPNAPTQMIKVY